MTAISLSLHRFALILMLCAAWLVVVPPARASQPDPGAPALEAMLARMPVPDVPGDLTIAYADLAIQLDVTGTARPESFDDPAFDRWLAATRGMPLPTSASPYGTFAREDYGFDLFQADRTLLVALPPFSLAIVEGRFDQDAIRQALEAAGYRRIEVDGREMLSLREDNAHDLNAPRGFQMQAMNDVAFIDADTIAFSSEAAPLAAVFDVAAGDAPSLLDAAGIRDLATSAPAGLVAAMFVPGGQLAGDPETQAEGASTDQLPPIGTALLGWTAGGPLTIDDAPVELPAGTPSARAVVLAWMGDAEAAQVAAAVIAARLDTGTSVGELWSAIFPEREVTAAGGVVVVELGLGPASDPNVLLNLLYNRDLGFLAW